MDYNDIEVSNLMCRHCKYWSPRPGDCQCKCINHSLIHFSRPFFSCDVTTSHHTICPAFEPDARLAPRVADEWEAVGGFEGWLPRFREQWHPRKNWDVETVCLISAFPPPHGREFSDDRFYAPIEEFYGMRLNGEEVKLKDYAHIERCAKSEANPLGYVWKHEGPCILTPEKLSEGISAALKF